MCAWQDEGYYQEEGKEAVEMKPGDCINIPAEVKHWHGAAPDSWFSHLAIEVPGEETSNEWCEPVTDEEYNAISLKVVEAETLSPVMADGITGCHFIHQTKQCMLLQIEDGVIFRIV